MAGIGYVTALTIIDEVIKSHGLDDKRPPLLHHYTSLTAALNIIQNREIRLSHSEYLNDATEIRGAITLITRLIEQKVNVAQNQSYHKPSEIFFRDVLSKFDDKTSLYEAYVFCLSAGDTTVTLQGQDVLSAWRAYGRDGRGVCLSYNSSDLALYATGDNGLRLSQVIYNEHRQEAIIAEILDKGWVAYNRSNNQQDTVAGTVAALVFMMPVLKHKAFEEELEWPFIFLPENQDPTASSLKFQERRDVIIPYYTMEDALDPPNQPKRDPSKARMNLTPHVAEIMIGPSGHQQLNLKSLEKLRGTATLRWSDIPYRS
jgi:hypothetical protein